MQRIPCPITSKQIQDLVTIEDVARILRELDVSLAGSALDSLHSFNTTYLIITEHVQQAMRENRFQDCGFLESFDICFAMYYLQALHDYCHDARVPSAWRITFEAAQRHKAPSLVVMALGVNAHVNNDIPQVLLETSATDANRPDYRLVNQVIKEALSEVLSKVQPHHPRLHRLYRPVMNVLIRLWRYTAWHHFEHLAHQRLSVGQIEKRAYIVGRCTHLILAHNAHG